MKAQWGLRWYVAQGTARLLQRRYGPLAAWPMLRVIWLSGALDGRRAPLGEGRWPALGDIEMLASGHCFMSPESDHAQERLLRPWPDLVERLQALERG